MFGVLRSPILGVKNTAAKLSSTKKNTEPRRLGLRQATTNSLLVGRVFL